MNAKEIRYWFPSGPSLHLSVAILVWFVHELKRIYVELDFIRLLVKSREFLY